MILTKILDYEVSPRTMQAFHLTQVILWTCMIPITFVLGFEDSVPFLVIVSILALVFSELSAWQGSLISRSLDKTDSYGEGNTEDTDTV